MALSARRRSAVQCRVGENGSNGLKWKDVSEEGGGGVGGVDKSGAGERKSCSAPCLSEGTTSEMRGGSVRDAG